MEAVKNDGYASKYASLELQNNYEIITECVKNNGYLLEYVLSELKIIMKL
jgi:hypothetical protein